jgi:hypothetical protein
MNNTYLILILGGLTALNTTATSLGHLKTAIAVIHHHTTQPVYTHVLKPTVKLLK